MSKLGFIFPTPVSAFSLLGLQNSSTSSSADVLLSVSFSYMSNFLSSSWSFVLSISLIILSIYSLMSSSLFIISLTLLLYVLIGTYPYYSLSSSSVYSVSVMYIPYSVLSISMFSPSISSLLLFRISSSSSYSRIWFLFDINSSLLIISCPGNYSKMGCLLRILW